VHGVRETWAGTSSSLSRDQVLYLYLTISVAIVTNIAIPERKQYDVHNIYIPSYLNAIFYLG